jgi:hypothetical protein
MATLIAVYNSEGCIGRCDAKCYNAKGPICNCVCGGMNHGCGHSQAIENTADMVELELEHLGFEEQLEKFKKLRGLNGKEGDCRIVLGDLQLRFPGFD